MKCDINAAVNKDSDISYSNSNYHYLCYIMNPIDWCVLAYAYGLKLSVRAEL